MPDRDSEIAAKRVGKTLAIEHLLNERGLRIVDQYTHEAVFVLLSLVRALSSALLDAAAEVDGDLVGDTEAIQNSGDLTG